HLLYFFYSLSPVPLSSTLFPYTTLFRSKRNNQELNNNVNKITISNSNFRGTSGLIRLRDNMLHVTEIHPPCNIANRWHDNIIYQGSDNFTKCTSDDHTYREINNTPSHGEFLKLF